MRSSKSRSRGNKNRSMRPTGGNVINRVFDSSGPDGKVRGTPQQIIEKYQQLHRDAQLSGDRVNAENFAQHAEHYTRMLAEAMREVERAREEQEQFNRERQAERDRDRPRGPRPTEGGSVEGAEQERGHDRGQDRGHDRPSPLGDVQGGEADDSGLIDLPEGRPAFLDARPRGDRRPRGGDRHERQPQERQPQERPQERQPQERPQEGARRGDAGEAAPRAASRPAPRPAPEPVPVPEVAVAAAPAPQSGAVPDTAPEAAPEAAARPARAPRSRKPRATAASDAPEAAAGTAGVPPAAE
ncbi:MAG: DUF4167 domain-containing protein [Rubellimicrobium sp.]|nr:DUF4167 domain-containing protein [Rubellimicrobium sp.]